MGFAVVADSRRKIDTRSADLIGSDNEALSRDDEESRVDRLDESAGWTKRLRSLLSPPHIRHTNQLTLSSLGVQRARHSLHGVALSV